jgi:transposase
VHWHAGRSKNEVAGSLGLSRNTVRKYVAAAEAAGMRPGGPAVSQERWAELAREWFPELAGTRLRQVTWPVIGEHRDYIVAQLEARVTVATIHQRLADERGLAVSVASLRRFFSGAVPLQPGHGGAVHQDDRALTETVASRLLEATLEVLEAPSAECLLHGRMRRWR